MAELVRVQSLVDCSGWPAVLAMAGRPVFPAELAEAEAIRLRNQYGVTVLRDLGGYPCVDPDGPGVRDWLAGLDERVTETAAAIEHAMEASRHG